jgi:hypothetical protein
MPLVVQLAALAGVLRGENQLTMTHVGLRMTN